MRKIIKKFILLTSFFFILYISISYGRNISFKIQENIYDSLRYISSIIFGFMGTWIAIIYPDTLKDIFNWKKTPQHLFIKRLFLPFKIAIITVILSLVLKWISPILKQIEIVVKNKEFFMIFSFFILSLSVLFLTFSLLMCFLPLEHAEEEMNDKKRKREFIDRKKGNAKFIRNKD